MPTFYTDRYRSTDSSFSEVYTCEYSWRPPITSSLNVLQSWKTMWDLRKRKRKGEYPNSDQVTERYTVPAPLRLPSYEIGGNYVYPNKIPWQTQITKENVMAFWPTFSDYSWGEFAFESLDGFSEQIPEEVSIYNFGWELQEIGGMIPKLSGSFLRDAAGFHLQREFAWEPFFDDLRKLNSLVSTVRSKIEHLRSTYGRYTRLSNVKQDLVGIPAWRDRVQITEMTSMRLAGYRADLRASGRLYHELRGLDTLDGELRAFAVALGLANPIKAFWNAIPFSFVVDWFTKIGDRLFDLDPNPFQGTWLVDRTSCTLTEHMDVDVFFEVPGSSTAPFFRLGTIACDRYSRLAHLPTELFTFNVRELNVRQQGLLLALMQGALKR